MPTNCDFKHNLLAYEGVENLSSFKSKQALEDYRSERIAFAKEAVDFIDRNLNSHQLSVMDIGSGSSCLLYALQENNLLTKGVGVEISKSRHAFAQKWKQEAAHDNVENILGDIADIEFDCEIFDLCLIVDNTFAYLQPIHPDLPKLTLDKAHAALKPGAFLLIEISTYPDAKSILKISSQYQEWVELPETNAFKYALYGSTMVSDEHILRVESRYLAREGQDTIKVEYSRLYTLAELETILQYSGFEVEGVYSSFAQQPYCEGESDRLIITARKQG